MATLSDAQRRRIMYEAGLEAGVTESEAAASAYPELPPAVAKAGGQATPNVNNVQIPANRVSNAEISRVVSQIELANRAAKETGVSNVEAYSMFDEIFKGLPEGAAPVPYNRVDETMLRYRKGIAVGITDQVYEASQSRKDMEFVGTALTAVFGSAQQGLFGWMAGENKQDVMARLWPKADVRDEEGVVQEKSVVGMAVKGLAYGAAGGVLDFFGIANQGDYLKGKARETAEQLAKSDYNEDLITGQELVEYWMADIGTPPPPMGSPERAEFDAEVRKSAAENYAAMLDRGGSGQVAMGAIALGGALADVFIDPLVIASEVPRLGVTGLRRLALPGTAARSAGSIADRSRRLTDIIDSVEKAERWVDKTAEVWRNNPTGANWTSYQHAQEFLARMLNRADVTGHIGEGEAFIVRTLPRLHPDHVKSVANVFLSTPETTRTATTRNFLSEQIRDKNRLVRKLEKRLERLDNAKPGDQPMLFDEAAVGLDRAGIQADLAAARDDLANWKASKKWFIQSSKNEKAGRLEGNLKAMRSAQEPYSPHSVTVTDTGMPRGSTIDWATVEDHFAQFRKLYSTGPVRALVDRTLQFVRDVAAAPDHPTFVALFDDFVKYHNEITRQMNTDVDGIEYYTEWMKANDKVREVLKAKAVEGGFADEFDSFEFLPLISGLMDKTKVRKGNKLDDLVRKLMWGMVSRPGMDEALSELRQYRNVPEAWDGVLTVASQGGLSAGHVSKKNALKAISENIRRGVAQGAPESELQQWERTYSRINALDDSEEFIQPTLLRSQESSEEIVASSLREQRQRALADEPLGVSDIEDIEDIHQLEQRIAFGPDQTEAAAEGAAILASGGEIDDFGYYGMSIGMYNSSYNRRPRVHSGTEMRGYKATAAGEMASEAELQAGGRRKVTQDERARLVRQSWKYRRLSPEEIAEEEKWLGGNWIKNGKEASDHQQSIGETFSDMWMKALEPRTWNARAPMILQNVREPMRALQSVMPRLYTRIHNAVRAQEFDLVRMNSIFQRELKTLGVYRDVKGGMVKDAEMSRRFYQIMNLDTTTDEYASAIATLSEAERRSLRRVRQELDTLADRMGISETSRYIEGYIDHVFDPRWFDEGAIPPEFQGLDASARLYNPYLLDRQGTRGFVEDLGLALDFYTRAASRKIHMEPLLQDMKDAARIHVARNPGDYYIAGYLDHMINNFKGKPTTLGQWADIQVSALNARMRAYAKLNRGAEFTGVGIGAAGAAVYNAGIGLSKLPKGMGRLGGAIASEGMRITEYGSQMALQGLPMYVKGDASRTALGVLAMVYSSVLGGSGRYFPMAISTALATNASRFGIFGTARGILAMGTSEGRALAKQVGLERQWTSIMEDAAWTKMGKLAANMPSFNGITVLGPSISATENLIRGWTFHATLGDLMRKQGFKRWSDVVEAGMANAYLHEALRTTEEVNHLFGQLGKPPAWARFSRSGSAGMTQFLSFIPKQSEELLSQFMSNPGKIGQYMMVSGYLQRTAAKAGLDISEYVGMGYLPQTPDEATSITFETLTSFMAMNGELADLSAGQGDLARARIKSELFLRNLQNYVPLAMATQRIGGAIETLRLGKFYVGGDYVRDADLGQFKWDPEKSYFENFLDLPRGLLSKTGDPAHPTELVSIMTHLNSVQGTLERRTYMAAREQANARTARHMEIMDSIRMAFRTGDGEAFQSAMAKAESEGMIPPQLSNMFKRAGYSAAFPRLMEMQLETRQQMLDMIETNARERDLYYMRFGRGAPR